MTRITQAGWLGLSHGANFRAGRFARLAGVSLRQMERVFRAHDCPPPRAFLDELRWWVAADRLGNGATPKAVATELGFHSLSWFYRQFRRYHGCPPRQFVNLQRRREAAHATRLAELGLPTVLSAPDPAVEAQGRLILRFMYQLKRELGR